MDRNRLMMLSAVMTGVVVLALGFFVGVQPQLSASADAVAQQDSVEQQNALLRSGLDDLKSDNEQLPTLQAELSTLQSSVPAQASLASFLSEIDGLSAASGTTITSFAATDAAAYQPEVAPTAEVAAPADGQTATDASAAPTAPVAPTLVTDPSITAANFSTIPISIGFQGSYDQARDFLGKLQGGGRLFLVTTFSSGGSAGDGSSSAVPDQWTVGGLVYVLQDAAATQADQAAETPAATAEGADGTSSDTAAGQ